MYNSITITPLILSRSSSFNHEVTEYIAIDNNLWTANMNVSKQLSCVCKQSRVNIPEAHLTKAKFLQSEAFVWCGIRYKRQTNQVNFWKFDNKYLMCRSYHDKWTRRSVQWRQAASRTSFIQSCQLKSKLKLKIYFLVWDTWWQTDFLKWSNLFN